ncbi:MAG: X-Pro dipeptidyl-peptidase-like [Ktedonobacterales bacterium]|jgi:putative CocE/NonD family hydrolase|nr:MAG: X-Pro dipeptidyl-peptidase-like [Ktedonobacterales bacterium]
MSMSFPAQTRLVFDQRVPMRDGVTLSADVMFPAGAPENGKRYPAIVLRTPYIKANPVTYANARYFAERGYVYVMMDVRGRGDSDGVWKPYVHDGRDGYDAIEWVAAQDWSNGKVGTLGGSYLGRIQWLAALEQPPHLGAMVVLVTPSDPFVETPTGLPSPMHLCWEHFVSGRVLQPMEAVQWSEVYEHLPLLTMDERAGRVMANWREQIAHAQMDEYWDRICYQNRFEQVNVPVLHISGWYDDEQIGSPMNYIGMTTRGAVEARDKQRLLMGPWGHALNTTQNLGEVDFGPLSLIDLKGEQARWFDRWLKDDEDAGGAAAVTIFVMGENAWRDEAEWPLARTQFTPFYLHSAGRANSRFGDGSLATGAPTEDEPHDGYRYDPARPVPFVTEPTSSQIGGPDDYAAIERRDDVLVYMTEPLREDVEVTGPVRVELYAASSARDTDFMAKLVDVHPDGFVQRLCDGMVRARFRAGMERPELIEPGQVYKYGIDCWNTAQVFKAGHRIGLEIASCAFPKYDRNLNTGAELGVTSEMVVAEQRILHDAAHPSAVVLPIIPR